MKSAFTEYLRLEEISLFFVLYSITAGLISGLYFIRKHTNKSLFRKDTFHILILPCSIHVLLLFNFSVVHEFAVLKFLPFLFVTTFILLHYLSLFFSKRAPFYLIIIPIIVVFLFFSKTTYETLKSNDNKPNTALIGKQVRETYHQQLPVFVLGGRNAEIVYYLGQVPFFINKEEEIVNLMKTRDFKKGYSNKVRKLFYTCKTFTLYT
jgi:hypothetical protein